MAMEGATGLFVYPRLKAKTNQQLESHQIAGDGGVGCRVWGGIFSYSAREAGGLH